MSRTLTQRTCKLQALQNTAQKFITWLDLIRSNSHIVFQFGTLTLRTLKQTDALYLYCRYDSKNFL